MFLKNDKVWSPVYGEGFVEDVCSFYGILTCVFHDFDKKVLYTGEGVEYRDAKINQTLFHSGSYITEAPEPPREYFPKPGDVCKIYYKDENILSFWRPVTVLDVSAGYTISVRYKNGMEYCFDLDKCKFKLIGQQLFPAKDKRPTITPIPAHLQWTNTPPQKEGYYWWRIAEKENACIKKVYFVRGALRFNHKEHEPPVSSFSTFQWAGPIPNPIEGEGND